MNLKQALVGTILGTAVGDAIGLPREGLSPARARRLFGDPPLRHRFLLGRGMISDDTEHTCMVAHNQCVPKTLAPQLQIAKASLAI